MATGLNVNRLISVSVTLSPQAAQYANFNSLLIVGDSNVIGVGQRIRTYNELSAVAADFGTSAPEYVAADYFFSQVPQPSSLMIGRWARTATSGYLPGGVLTTAQQALSLWTAITSGGFDITIDGTAHTLTGLNFSAVTNLNGVASDITAALSSAGTCTWNGSNFTITSASTGTSSAVGYATAPASGTDISTMLALTVATASPAVAGIAAESALAAVTILDANATPWYGLMFATPDIADSDHEAIAAYIEGASNPHIYGVSTTETTVLSSTVTTDIASVLMGSGYNRTFVQYSAMPYAAASFFGRAFTVNFNGNNTMITMMYKTEPGITPETLSLTQANTLDSKNCNYYVYYNNNTAILQNGNMCSGRFFDEVQGTDWLRNRIQVDLWNVLYTSSTKIPQTDAGNQLLVNTVNNACAAAVNNGLVAPGTWNSTGFGTLNQGDNLPKGYYVYAAPVSTQSQADREARKSMPIQAAIKLAGAIHSVDVSVLVNR